MKGGSVYILASQRNGTLYIGVTSDLPGRIYEHREGLIAGFTRRYAVKLLVWYENHGRIDDAIQREKNLKHWVRKWKIDLIEKTNPAWDDLYPKMLVEFGFASRDGLSDDSGSSGLAPLARG